MSLLSELLWWQEASPCMYSESKRRLCVYLIGVSNCSGIFSCDLVGVWFLHIYICALNKNTLNKYMKAMRQIIADLPGHAVKFQIIMNISWKPKCPSFLCCPPRIPVLASLCRGCHLWVCLIASMVPDCSKELGTWFVLLLQLLFLIVKSLIFSKGIPTD